MRDFKLSDKFIEPYKTKEVNWGFGDLSYTTFLRSYARLKDDGYLEEWWECCRRVTEGTFSVQKQHCSKNGLEWQPTRAQKTAHIFFDKMFNFKWTPPGRGLAYMGTPVIEKLGSLPIINCAFTSTKNIHIDFTEPFCFLMDVGLLGVGPGFDVKGAGKVTIQEPKKTKSIYIIEDSREGWISATRITLDSFMGKELPEFDFSLIRPEGAPIRTLGGIAPGPDPLRKLLKQIQEILNPLIGNEITSVAITELMNVIGVAVVSGGIRRIAEVGIANHDDYEFIEMKDPIKYKKELNSHRWASNNSVTSPIGHDYSKIAEKIKLNGEPGLIWMDNVHSFGRRKDGYDDTDQAEGFNPCVTGDTEIITKNGYKSVASLENQLVEIWNGFEFSWVTPMETAINQEILKITLSDGRSIKCTPYHKWRISTSYTGDFVDKKTEELKIGDKIIKYEFPSISDGIYIDPKQAYTQGFVSAEGMDNYEIVWIYTPKEMCVKRMLGCHSSSRFDASENSDRSVFKLGFNPRPKSFVPFEWSIWSRLEWLSGLLDGDGCELKEGGCQLVSIDRKFLEDLQKLISLCGENCKVVDAGDAGYRLMPDGRGGMKEYWCQKTWRICIGATQIQNLKLKGLNCERLKFNKNPNRDASQFTKIISIEDAGVAEKVYCFTEPKRNLAVFNGILTGQCLEQPLYDKEVCTLAETYPANHDSFEEYLETMKYAFIYAKTVTLIPTHIKKTNAMIAMNRRIGLSQSGIEQAITKFGKRIFFEKLCDLGYQELKKWDKVYSNWLGVPRSNRITTVKPSGSVSLLTGATPGIHKPIANRYIRYIGWSRNHPFIECFKKAGYIVEINNRNEESTEVLVLFPVDQTKPVRYTEETTNIWEQFQLAADMQYWWSDNGVSVTVKFDPKTEGDQIKDCLETYEDKLKAVSLLPKWGHRYIQAPYTLVSDEFKKEDRYQDGYRIIWTNKEFDEYMKRINSKILRKEISKIKFSEDLGTTDKFCEGDKCLI